MGVINVKVDDEVETAFRRRVLEVKGGKKGTLGPAVEEAIKLWTKKKDKQGEQ